MKKLLLITLLLGGCGGYGYQRMSAEQISALAKMKDANVNCIIINSPWGKGVTTFVNLDKGVVPAGSVSVDQDCKVTITNAPPAKP